MHFFEPIFLCLTIVKCTICYPSLHFLIPGCTFCAPSCTFCIQTCTIRGLNLHFSAVFKYVQSGICAHMCVCSCVCVGGRALCLAGEPLSKLKYVSQVCVHVACACMHAIQNTFQFFHLLFNSNQHKNKVRAFHHHHHQEARAFLLLFLLLPLSEQVEVVSCGERSDFVVGEFPSQAPEGC